jgi:hypothetical protein
MSASLELHDVIASAGTKPLSARLRSGEVVRVEGAPRAVSALLDVMAGRTLPCSGTVVMRGGGRLLVRDGETLAAGVEPGDAIAVWSALADPMGARVSQRGPRAPDEPRALEPATRGVDLVAPVWIVDGELTEASEQIAARAAESVRAGDGLMIWTPSARRERADRVLTIEPADAREVTVATASTRAEPARAKPWPWRAIARFAAAAAMARAAIAVGVVVALWTAAAAATVGAHEGFWFAAGSAGALHLVAQLSTWGAIALTATASAARAAAAPTWPAMLRETDARPIVRAAVLFAGDAGGAAIAAIVAALPSLWVADPIGALVTWLACVAVAGAAGAITRICLPMVACRRCRTRKPPRGS